LIAQWAELFPLRLAAGSFVVSGIVEALTALAAPSRVVELAGAYSGGIRITLLLEGALFIAIGIGILMRRRTWRVLGAFFGGLPAGVALALIVVGYGFYRDIFPGALLVPLLVQLGAGGFQLWALTSPVAYRYCSR
jgi:hypothetical protein